ncbi:hypothetical protein BDF14DRAFT_1856017 [Spinellus fusiger]|nr:hypothetical protein BDF14DRAFT_1856017 [Spinellus fusiger]
MRAHCFTSLLSFPPWRTDTLSSEAGREVLHSRSKNYCLIHKRYFETSWCPECGRIELARATY